MLEKLRDLLAPLMPGAVPAAAASAGAVVGTAALGAPSWLLAIAQAAIVVVWTSNAIEQKFARVSSRLDALELAIREHGIVSSSSSAPSAKDAA